MKGSTDFIDRTYLSFTPTKIICNEDLNLSYVKSMPIVISKPSILYRKQHNTMMSKRAFHKFNFKYVLMRIFIEKNVVRKKMPGISILTWCYLPYYFKIYFDFVMDLNAIIFIYKCVADQDEVLTYWRYTKSLMDLICRKQKVKQICI